VRVLVEWNVYVSYSGEGTVYHLDEMTGALVISHTLVISSKDYPGMLTEVMCILHRHLAEKILLSSCTQKVWYRPTTTCMIAIATVALLQNSSSVYCASLTVDFFRSTCHLLTQHNFARVL